MMFTKFISISSPVYIMFLADEKEASVVERLFSSSLIVVVNKGAPNLLKVCHFRKGSEICSYTYPTNVLAARLNRQVG